MGRRPSMGTVPLPTARGVSAASLAPAGLGIEPPTRGGDATLFDGAPAWPAARQSGAPAWPVAPRSARETSESRQFFSMPLAALAAALIALALVATLVVASLVQGGAGGAPGTAKSGTHLIATATPSPTVTPEPTATATPFPADWLSVSPGSVTLACRGKGMQKSITLRNLGPDTLDWQAQVSSDGIGSPLSVQPAQGTLDSGERVSITLTATSYFKRQGDVSFNPSDSSAGQPADVTFSISSGCL